MLRAAANSMAKGKPSNCTQISATAWVLVAVKWNVGLVAWARETKRATAGR